jgi:D-glycero-D-manno-heptose 1,7-bisphosphate phosphatase
MWTDELDTRWTLFLDRDGVINVRKMGGYILDTAEFEFLPQVRESIAAFSGIFGHVFVVTNQQGIAKGLMTERNLSDIHTYMCQEVEKAGGKITACYFAPELKTAEPETTVPKLRKPGSGMAMLAKAAYPEIDFSKSVMVGDTDSDIRFGQNLGMKTVRIRTEEPIGVEADLTVEHLYELMELWKK